MPNYLRDAINDTKGGIFSVHFQKANGEHREMVCRTSVKKGVKGVRDVRPIEQAHDTKIVYDMKKREFRTIPLNRVTLFKFNGRSWSL